MDKIIGFTKDGMPVRVYNMTLQTNPGIGIGGIATIVAIGGLLGVVAIIAADRTNRHH
jgi:hypothetical protein